MEINKLEQFTFGELLQKFRKSKRFNQEQLAKEIGVTRETVSLWERGQYKPDTETILYELVRVLDLTEQESLQFFEAYTVTVLAASFHNPPLERNPYFTGRNSQLSKLHTLLMAGKQVALTQAISGLGGIGKTQLALEYAYRYQKSYHDIFWVTAENYDSLMTSYVWLATILHLSEYNEQDQNKVKAAVQRWLSRHKGWLLILDNIEDLSLVHQFVPTDRRGAVLLTTRRHVTEPVAQALELELLPEDDAILFLLKRTKVLADASDRDIVATRAIAQLLGNLPLALDQAGAYILETSCSFADYLTLFQQHRTELLQRRIGEGTHTDHPDSVATTFTLNFQQVQQRNKVAGELLRVCAFLAPDDIGEEIFVKGAGELGPILQSLGSDTLLLNKAVEVLYTFSLIRRDPKKKNLSTHRLVQAVLKDEMDKEMLWEWVERTIQALNFVFPNYKLDVDKINQELWYQCERLLSHTQEIAILGEQLDCNLLEVSSLITKAALYLSDRARYDEAKPLHQRALRIRERLLGLAHPDTAQSLNNLAVLYWNQGEYTEAEPLLQRALTIYKKQLGPEHPNTAEVINDLANVYMYQGKYTEAEPLFQQALAICKRQLGPEHPNTASSLNNLASLYWNQGKYVEAEPLLQQALIIRKQKLGANHPNTTNSLNNLAMLYWNQGKYAEAEPLYQQALATREQQLGADHANTANSLSNLANLYRSLGKYTEAEPLYQRALTIYKKQLGPEHPNTANGLHNLASLHWNQGKYAEAESLLRQALAIREQKLGSEHSDTAHSLNSLANLYMSQSKYAEAKPLYERALWVWRQQLRPDHPNVARPLDGLASLYREMGDFAQAESLYQQALQIRQQQLGPKHPEIAETMYGLAQLRHAQGNSEEAKVWYARVLEIREQTLGAHHPTTTETRTRLITLLHAMGQHEEAARLEALQTKHQEASEEEQKTHPEE